jgi:hypothetical protein
LGEGQCTDVIGTSDEMMRYRALLDAMIEVLQPNGSQYIMLSWLYQIDNGDSRWYNESLSYPTLYYSAFLGIL